MKRRLRILLTFAGVLALVMVLNMGAAFGHPNADGVGEEAGAAFPGAGSNGKALVPIDPLFGNGAFTDFSEGGAGNKMNLNGQAGIIQGFTLHSPMCTDHYVITHADG